MGCATPFNKLVAELIFSKLFKTSLFLGANI
jgi:hypothetical protein